MRLRERAIRDEQAPAELRCHPAPSVPDTVNGDQALAGLRASLHSADEKARVAQAVSQRARAEVSGEHNALLEAQARLDFAEEETRSLKARLDAAEREKSFLLAACNQGGKAERL